jgi:hypothetical protein
MLTVGGGGRWLSSGVLIARGRSHRGLVAVGTLLVVGGLLTAIIGPGLLGGGAMLIGLVVFVVGRLL